MRLAISLKRGEDPAQFAVDLQAAGCAYEAVEGLPRHFFVEAPSGLALARAVGPSRLSSVTEADRVVSAPQDAQALILDKRLENASWALARTIRRRAPWDVDRLVHPISTFYECERDGTGVDIYWFDTGLRTSHDEFGGRASTVYSYTGSTGDTFGHGTRQASVAAGATLGFARGATILSFNIEASAGGGAATNASALACLGQALTHYNGRAGLNRPAVANCSFEPVFTTTVNDAVEDLMDAGMVFCWSAGNGGQELVYGTFPTAFVDDLIVSGASAAADLPLNCSLPNSSGGSVLTNYGAQVDIISPGCFIRHAAITGDGDYMLGAGGTSAGSAHTAGVVACILQGHDRLTSRAEVTAVRAALLANATTGKFRNTTAGTLPDRLLYLDPARTAPESIPDL
jgi:subtilisin family serine protease